VKLSSKQFDVIVIGAGGAGMMCASQAAARGRSVALLDHTNQIGRKILISGGGRCNFTNIHAQPNSFVSQNPHFCKSALSRFMPSDFIELVKKYRIPFHEKKLGQLFCDGSAENIVQMLISECKKAGAEFHLDCRINNIESGKHSPDNIDEGYFEIHTSRGTYECASLIIATGGLSIPQIGATGFGYEVARQFGLKIIPTTPALDGFNFSNSDLKQFADLAGVSVDTKITCNDASFRENILFTHTGLSGPAILQASLYWQKSNPIQIDLLPELDATQWLLDLKNSGNRMDAKNVVADKLPKRLAERICQLQRIDHSKIFQLNEKQLNELGQSLNNFQIYPAGTVGYRKAEVTRGGVATSELSSKTMEAKKVKGLYFIGEVVDVTGQLGGFNFQWAWASGYAAGQYC